MATQGGEECQVTTVETRFTAVIRAQVRLADIREAQRSLRQKIGAALASAKLGTPGAALTLWRPPVDGVMEMEPGVLVSSTFAPVDELVPSTLPSGRAAQLVLAGGFEGIPAAWQRLFDWCATNQLTLAGINWEIYGCGSDDPTASKTTLYALIGGAS